MFIVVLIVFFILTSKTTAKRDSNRANRPLSVEDKEEDLTADGMSEEEAKSIIGNDKLLTFLEKNEVNRQNPESCEREPMEGELKIPIKEITPKMSLFLGRECFTLAEVASLKGYNNVCLPKFIWDDANERLKTHLNEEDLIHRTAELNNKGIILEQEGYIDEAIRIYEECIATGGAATHSYDRLMILYKKRGDWENEKRVVNLAISKFGSSDKLSKRLEHIQKIERREYERAR